MTRLEVLIENKTMETLTLDYIIIYLVCGMMAGILLMALAVFAGGIFANKTNDAYRDELEDR